MKQLAERVVVTGMGCVSPLGLDVPSTFDALIAGRSGCAAISSFDTEGFSSCVAAEVKGEPDPGDVSDKDLRRFDRSVLFGLSAAREAIADSGLEVSDANRDRVGVVVGSGIGGLITIIENQVTLMERGPRRVSPFTIPMGIGNMSAGLISVHHGLRGPNFGHVSACASGSHSIGEGAEMIRRGQADVMVAGGSEAPIIGVAVAGFASMKALSKRNHEPQKASRPFDRARDGFVIGEGATILVLESLKHARGRGARIHAELLGYGAAADANHMVAPDAEGEGAARCMELALADSGIPGCEVGYVNAHATSTPAGDPAEVLALRRVFGPHLDRLPVSSTKSMTGHLLGASGALEAVATVCSLESGILPPTINLDDPDPACQLDHVAHKARAAKVGAAVSNSFGFGGTNCSLIFGLHDL